MSEPVDQFQQMKQAMRATWMAGDFAIDQTGKIWIYTGAKWVAGGSATAG